MADLSRGKKNRKTNNRNVSYFCGFFMVWPGEKWSETKEEVWVSHPIFHGTKTSKILHIFYRTDCGATTEYRVTQGQHMQIS